MSPQDQGVGQQAASLNEPFVCINTFVASASRHAFLILDKDRQNEVVQTHSKLKSCNPAPGNKEVWKDGGQEMFIPTKGVKRDPAFRISGSDHLPQMAELNAHTPLRQEKKPSHSLE